MRTFSIFLNVAIVFALPFVAKAQFSAAPGSPFPAGAGPTSVVAADFNEDGIKDLAIADASNGKVTVLLGNPPATGGFTPASESPITVGTRPVALTVFSVSGHASLAVANEMDSSITVLLGNGNGTFTPGATVMLPSGSEPDSLAAGSFNGNVLLAVADLGNKSVTVLLGNGTSVFTQTTLTVGNNPASVVISDFNGDGKPDLAVANETDGSITVLLGTVSGGNLSFTPAPGSPFPVIPLAPVSAPPPYPMSLAVADFNGDGIPDLAVANQGIDNLTVLLGNGAGGFAAAPNNSPTAVGSKPSFVTVGYFNDDLIPDVAISCEGDGTVWVLLGNGAGGFIPGSTAEFTPATGNPFTSGSAPRSVAVADFNGDGIPDLAIANNGDNTVTVLLNMNTFPVTVSAASGSGKVAVGSIVAIYGANFTKSAASATVVPLPFVLGGASATITDSTGAQAEMPLFYAGPTQINAMIPSTAATGPATVTIYPASASGPPQTGPLLLVATAPSLFSANATGQGVAAAELVGYAFQTFTYVFQCPSGAGTCVTVPLDVSSGTSQLVLYGTGIRNATKPVTVNVGTQSLPAVYAGAAPYSVGEDQVNVVLPATLPAGLTPVSVSTGGLTSNIVTIYIQ